MPLPSQRAGRARVVDHHEVEAEADRLVEAGDAVVPLEFTSTFFGITFVPISSTEAGDRMRTPSSSPPLASICAKRA